MLKLLLWIDRRRSNTARAAIPWLVGKKHNNNIKELDMLEIADEDVETVSYTCLHRLYFSLRLMCNGRAFCFDIWSLIYIFPSSITCPPVACQHPDIKDTMDQNPLFCTSFNRLKDTLVHRWGLIVHRNFLEPNRKTALRFSTAELHADVFQKV